MNTDEFIRQQEPKMRTREQDVLQLHIAVNDDWGRGVQGLQPLCYLQAPLETLCIRVNHLQVKMSRQQ